MHYRDILAASTDPDFIDVQDGDYYPIPRAEFSTLVSELMAAGYTEDEAQETALDALMREYRAGEEAQMRRYEAMWRARP